MDAKLVYEETGRNYRYFLDWRNKIVAGYIATLGALALGYSGAKSIHQQIAILGSAILLSFVFWVFDYRNRDVYWICQHAGARLEIRARIPGSCSALDTLRFDEATSGNSALKQTRSQKQVQWVLKKLTHGLAVSILVSHTIAASSTAVIYKVWRTSDPGRTYCLSMFWIITFTILVLTFERLGKASYERQQAQRSRDLEEDRECPKRNDAS